MFYLIQSETGLQQWHKGLCSEGYSARVCGGGGEEDTGDPDRRPTLGEHTNGSTGQPATPGKSLILC